MNYGVFFMCENIPIFLYLVFTTMFTGSVLKGSHKHHDLIDYVKDYSLHEAPRLEVAMVEL